MSGNTLLDEPKDLQPHHIYQGGSALGVTCASCHADNTSGSWRRGWVLKDKNNANLCNRCGQRWVKLGKAAGRDLRIGSNETRSRPVGHKALLPPSATGADSNTGNKRLRVAYDPVASMGVGSMAGVNRMMHRFMSENASDNSDNGAVNSPRAAAAAALPERRIHRGGPTSAFCVQKVASGKGAYALFWVVDTMGGCTLAAVGVDPRSSGHFTYTHSPSLTGQVPPLRCSNRSDVVAWLTAAFGVDRSLPESMVRPPILTADHLERLLGSAGDGRTIPGGNTFNRPDDVDDVDLQFLDDDDPFLGMDFTTGSAAPLGSPSRSSHGAKIKPQMRPLPRFKCVSCGRDDHGTDDCPLGCVSPPTLIHDAGPSTFMLMDGGGPAHGTFLLDGLHEDGDSPVQDTTFNNSYLEFSMPVAGSPGAVSPGGAVNQPPPSAQPTVRQLSAAAAAAFAPQPELHNWVSALPPQGVEDTVAAWARLLSGHISDTCPPTPVSDALVPLGGLRWVPTGEALAVLHQLSSMRVNLALLEKTQISRAVAMLRTHTNALIAGVAEDIVDKWRNCAVAALEMATQAGARQQP